jgi:hypothetical protein
MITEILSPNALEVRKHGHKEAFCAYLNPQQPGELTTYQNAVREAIALGADGCVGYVEETAPAAIDYNHPLPGILSRKKRTTSVTQ